MTNFTVMQVIWSEHLRGLESNFMMRKLTLKEIVKTASHLPLTKLAHSPFIIFHIHLSLMEPLHNHYCLIWTIRDYDILYQTMHMICSKNYCNLLSKAWRPVQHNPSTNQGFFPEIICAFFAFLALAASLKTAIPQTILGKTQTVMKLLFVWLPKD